MNVKKLLALLLALTIAAGLLAGCDRTPGQEQPETTQAAEETAPTEPAEPASWLDRIYDPVAGAGKFSIYFINATKDYVTDSSVTHAGDSTLLVSPDGKTMLIDLNNQANGPEIVAACQKLGIDTLDYLVFSHPHADHIGSYAVLLRYLKVNQVIMNGHDYSAASSQFAGLMAALEAKQIPVTIVAEGDVFRFGQEVEVTVMNPPRDYVFDDESAAGNNGSLLLRFVYGQSSYLTGGDLYTSQEKVLVEKYGDALKTDVVKINHHGYNSSSCKEWVAAVDCKIAACEANGVNSEVVEGRYRLSGAQTLYTCLDGTVAVRTTGDGTYEVQVEKEREIILYGELTELPGYQEGSFVIQ